MELDKKNYRQNDNKFRYFNRLAPWRVLGCGARQRGALVSRL